MSNSVAVAILNWNGISHLKTFLPSLVKHSEEATVYIIDNGSTDESVPFVRTAFPHVQIIQLLKNNGYAGGYNEGLAKITDEYCILINSDVEVTPGWIKPLIDPLKNGTVGVSQPKILSYTNKSRFEYAGAAGGYIDKYGYPFCRGRLFDHSEEDSGQYNDSLDLFWASGACMALKKDVFLKSGGFDSDFFAHMEEIDLCWRIQRLGYKIVFSPESVVYHLGGGTLSYSSPRKTFLNFRNNLLMLVKNLPSKKLLGVILIKLCLDGLAGIRFLIKGELKHCIAIIQAHFYLYSHFSKFRKKVKLPYLLPLTIYKGSIVFLYFFKGIKTFSDLKWHPGSTFREQADKNLSQIHK